mmetsp:Transcript_82561/g.239017  ORF Transcript_82561/g.239017 Transcript_82561/m.239017 type:complete len:367 (-) Transcript_82561:75-1175(-)
MWPGVRPNARRHLGAHHGMVAFAQVSIVGASCLGVWCPSGYECDGGVCVQAGDTGGSTAPPLQCSTISCPKGYSCQTRADRDVVCFWDSATVTYGPAVSRPRPASTTPFIFDVAQEEGGGANTTMIILIGIGSGICGVCFLIALLLCSMTCSRKVRDLQDKTADLEAQQVHRHRGVEAAHGGPRRIERRGGERCHSEFVDHELNEHHDDGSGLGASPLSKRMDHHHERFNESEHQEKRSRHHRHAREHSGGAASQPGTQRRSPRGEGSGRSASPRGGQRRSPRDEHLGGQGSGRSASPCGSQRRNAREEQQAGGQGSGRSPSPPGQRRSPREGRDVTFAARSVGMGPVPTLVPDGHGPHQAALRGP